MGGVDVDRWFNVTMLALGAVFIGLLVWFRDATTVFLAVAFLAVLLVFNATIYARYIRHKQRRIAFLSSKLQEKDTLLARKDDVEERLADELPVGIILINREHDIQWANAKAKEIFHNSLESRNLELLHKELKEKLRTVESNQPFVMKIYEYEYDIVYDIELQAIYLFHATEREEIKRRHHDLTDCIGVMHLDNFDDATTVLDVQERNELQGKFLGAIDDWADEHGFYVIPLTSSKLVVFMHRKNLERLMEDKFTIVDTIAALSRDNDLHVTLSGGFACANIPLNQLADLAEEGLDIAFDRGGDQIVVNIQDDAIRYYGGNTNTVEKRTRISSRINAKKLAALIEESERVFIVPHKHSDTDALGSAIGVLKIAQALKRDAHIVLDFNTIDKTVKKITQLMEYEYVTFLERFISPEEALEEAGPTALLVLMDHHSYGQTPDVTLVEKSPSRAIIDHHRKLDDFIKDTRLAYIEPYASSSTELVVEMLDVFKKNVTLNPFEATVMLSGIIVDTNNFMYRSGARTFEAAAVLRKHGADMTKVKNILRESHKEIQLKASLLSRAEVIKKRFSLVVVPDDIDADRTLLAQVADDMLEIDNIVAGFAIGKLDNQYIGISARSLEGFNVQTLMEKFGGGGHLNNAGAQVESIAIDEVKKQLIDVLENSIQEEKPMKVILMKDLKNKGKKGDVINVAPGYGNYLLTSKQAIEATPENMQVLEDEHAKAADQARQELEEAKALKERIDFRAVKLYVKVGENGKMYGKITTKQIADAMKEQHGIDLDKRKIHLDKPITTLGTTPIEVKLHKDVSATFELLVVEA